MLPNPRFSGKKEKKKTNWTPYVLHLLLFLKIQKHHFVFFYIYHWKEGIRMLKSGETLY